MSILDDFQDFGLQAQNEATRDDFSQLDLGSFSQEPIAPVRAAVTADRPLFSIGMGTWERHVTRGRGQVVAVASAKDVVIVATARNYILRYNYSMDNFESASSFEYEVEIFKPVPDSKITDIFLDTSTHHLLVNLKSPLGFETHYIHTSFTKSRALPRLKGICLESVAFRRLAPPIKEPGKEARDFRIIEDQAVEHTSREVLIGGSGGCLYCLVVEPREKKEKVFKKLFDFKDSDITICGVAQQILRDGKLFVMMVTNAALYVLTGSQSLEQLFSVYTSGQAVLEPFCELPVPGVGSHLSLSLGLDGWPQRFAWLVPSGVYHGKLSLDHARTPDNSECIDTLHLWRLERAEQAKHLGTPVAMASTDYHFVIMFEDGILFVNRINGKMVQETSFHARGSRVTGQALGLAPDRVTGIVYLFTSDGLVDVGSDGEDQDIWRVFMEMHDFPNALAVCRNHSQEDEVFTTQAEDAMSRGNNIMAAQIYAKLHSSCPTFEDIALKFIQLEDGDALQHYLGAKLESLGAEDRAQKTMVASWLTELYLDKINRALLEESGEQGSVYQKCVADLRKFLSAHVDVLDMNTTVSLLASYGRMDDLMHFAECRHDHETLLECLMQRRDVRRALGVMRLPSVSQELVYKFAPDLMGLEPGMAVDFWISQKNPPLDPRRLLPALVPYGEYGSNEESRKHAIRYINFSINTLGCQDSAIHNLMIALYSLDSDESLLVDFIEQSAQNALGSLCFDSKYALRLVRERDRPKACVSMLCILGLYEDAVALALSIDFALAKSVARSPDLEDEGSKRKLWLAIARHVIQNEDADVDQEEHISRSVGLLDDADGLLKIEDILPFFPDFVTIDKFQGPIQHSLEEYNKQIDHLKTQMDEATDIADALRKDMKVLETRTAIVNFEEPCARCKGPLGEGPRGASGLPSGGSIQPFFVFPTGLSFHGVCLCAEVLGLVGERKQQRIKKLMTRLSKVEEGALKVPADEDGPEESVASLQKQLEAEVALECPRNGEVVIRMIEKPFIDTSQDKDEIRSWKIRLPDIS